VGARRHLPLRRRPPPRRGLRHRHPAAHRQRLPARRPRLLVHAHRHHRPLPPDAGPRRLLSDGLGRQRTAHRAEGPELLRRAVRPLTPLRPRVRRADRAVRAAPARQPAQLHRAVPRAHGRGRAGLRGPVAQARAVRRLEPHLRHHRRSVPAGRATCLPAQPGPGRGLSRRGPRALGRRLPDRRRPGRARGPREAGCLPPHLVLETGRRAAPHRDHPPRAGPRLRRPRRPPRRRALPPAVRHDGAHPAVRRGRRGQAARAGRSREGLGHRHDLHLRRRHRRRVVARARPAHPLGHGCRRPVAGGASGGDRPGRLGGHLRRAGRQDRQPGPTPHRRAAHRVGRPRRRAPAHHPPREVLREGRAPPRDHHQWAVVPPQRRARHRPARAAAAPRQGVALAPSRPTRTGSPSTPPARRPPASTRADGDGPEGSSPTPT
jgi:hypothetical protein